MILLLLINIYHKLINSVKNMEMWIIRNINMIYNLDNQINNKADLWYILVIPNKNQ